MSSFTYSPPGTYLTLPYPPGWVDTVSTCRILNEIRDTYDKITFMNMVASMANSRVGRDQIEACYANPRPDSIPGYHPQTRSEGSGDSRQAGSERQIGANEGRTWDNGDSYARRPGIEWDYTVRSNLQDPSRSLGNQHPRNQGLRSGNDRSGDSPSPPSGHPRYPNPPSRTDPTLSGNRTRRSPREFRIYEDDDEHSSGSDWSGSTLVSAGSTLAPSDSVSQGGRTSRGNGQGRMDSWRLLR